MKATETQSKAVKTKTETNLNRIKLYQTHQESDESHWNPVKSNKITENLIKTTKNSIKPTKTQ